MASAAFASSIENMSASSPVRHPGESRGLALLPLKSYDESWIPAFAGMTAIRLDASIEVVVSIPQRPNHYGAVGLLDVFGVMGGSGQPRQPVRQAITGHAAKAGRESLPQGCAHLYVHGLRAPE